MTTRWGYIRYSYVIYYPKLYLGLSTILLFHLFIGHLLSNPLSLCFPSQLFIMSAWFTAALERRNQYPGGTTARPHEKGWGAGMADFSTSQMPFEGEKIGAILKVYFWGVISGIRNWKQQGSRTNQTVRSISHHYMLSLVCISAS